MDINPDDYYATTIITDNVVVILPINVGGIIDGIWGCSKAVNSTCEY